MSNLSGRGGRHSVILMKINSCMNVFVLVVVGENMICHVFGWLDGQSDSLNTSNFSKFRNQYSMKGLIDSSIGGLTTYLVLTLRE